jgi:hypothetical protein
MITPDSRVRGSPGFPLVLSVFLADIYSDAARIVRVSSEFCRRASILESETAHAELMLIRNLFLIRRPAKRSLPKIPFIRRFLSDLFRAPNSWGFGCPQSHVYGHLIS